MSTDDAEEAVFADTVVPVQERLPENCIVEVPSIVLVIETGLGYYTYPMLVIETKMNAEVRDWSSEISIESSLSLGMAYYNSTMAVWEPLIEPNEREKSNGLTEYGPWELNFSMKIEKNLDETTDQCKTYLFTVFSSSSLFKSFEFFSETVEPKTKISISSSDTLEMSVTKTCLDVLQDLGKAFSDAIRPEGLHKPDIIAPYIVENDTGFDITLNLKQGALYLHSTHLPNSVDSDGAARSGVVFQSTASDVEPKQVTDCRISPGGKAYLQAKQASALSSISAFSSLNSSQLQEMFLHVQVRNIASDEYKIRLNKNHSLPDWRYRQRSHSANTQSRS